MADISNIPSVIHTYGEELIIKTQARNGTILQLVLYDHLSPERQNFRDIRIAKEQLPDLLKFLIFPNGRWGPATVTFSGDFVEPVYRVTAVRPNAESATCCEVFSGPVASPTPWANNPVPQKEFLDFLVGFGRVHKPGSYLKISV
jgi:hypothetical protein